MTFAQWCAKNGIALDQLSTVEATALEAAFHAGQPNRVPQNLHSTGTVTLTAAEGDGEGQGRRLRRFQMNAYNGGAMLPRFYYLPVVVDLEGLTVPSQTRPILRDHNPAQIVGHTDQITVTASVDVAGVISAANEHAGEVIESGDNGFPWQSSIGLYVARMAFVDEEEEVEVNGQTFAGPILVARETTLKEVSFVALGADDTTSATIAASAASHTLEVYPMNFEQWLSARGFTLADLDDAQKKSLRAIFDRETAPPAAGNGEGGSAGPTTVAAAAGRTTTIPTTTVEASGITAAREAEAAEIERSAAVRRLFAAATFEGAAEMHATATREGWTAQRAELEILRESRQQAPAIHSHSHDGDCTADVLQAAMMLRCGLAIDSPHWQTFGARALLDRTAPWLARGLNDDVRQRAMELSHRFNDTSLVDLCRESTRLDGHYVGHGRQAIIEAAFSGGSLANILTTSFNAVLLMSYIEAPDTTMGWTQEEDVADYKLNERPRMTTSDNLEKLGPGGEAKHDKYSDVGESYRIARYAKQSQIDEIDVINDRMNAFGMDGAGRHGRAARRLRPDLVYAAILANRTLGADGKALFHTDHSNTDSSAGLASGKLKVGISKIETQQENGVTLGLRASHLIVPSALKHTGAELLNSSSIVIAGTAGAVTERGSANTIATEENLTLVSDGRLDNGVVDPDTENVYAGAASDWYLAAANGHTIEVGYLRGTGRAPTVRMFTLTQGKFGIGWDVKHSIGILPKDFRSLYRGQG